MLYKPLWVTQNTILLLNPIPFKSPFHTMANNSNSTPNPLDHKPRNGHFLNIIHMCTSKYQNPVITHTHSYTPNTYPPYNSYNSYQFFKLIR